MAKKVLPYTVAFILGALCCFFFAQGHYSRTIDSISERLVEGEKLNDKLRSTSRALAEQNSYSRKLIEELRGENKQLVADVGRARTELGDIKRIIGGIGTGLGEGADIIYAVITGLEQLKNAVRLLP